MTTAPWQRADTRATGRIANAVFVAFHHGALADDVPLSASRFGAPSREALTLLDIQEVQDPAWIAGWRAGAMRASAQTRTGLDLADLDRADRCHLVRATVADPMDHVHLQAAWAAVRWLRARGAAIVLDAFPLRWWPGDALDALAGDAAFELDREISIMVETAPVAPERQQVMHTRGLGKLARPDLVALIAPADIDAAGSAVRQVAGRLADGWMPADGELIGLPGHPWQRALLTAAPAGSIAEALHLNNDAWVVTRDS